MTGRINLIPGRSSTCMYPDLQKHLRRWMEEYPQTKVKEKKEYLYCENMKLL